MSENLHSKNDPLAGLDAYITTLVEPGDGAPVAGYRSSVPPTLKRSYQRASSSKVSAAAPSDKKLTWNEQEAIRAKERMARFEQFRASLSPGLTQAERKTARDAFSRKLCAEHDAWIASLPPEERAEYDKGLEAYKARIEAERIRIEAEHEAKANAKLKADAKAEVEAEWKKKARLKHEAKAAAAKRARDKAEAKRDAKTEILEDDGDPDKFVRPLGGGAPVKNSAHNIILALRKLDVRVTYDEFADRTQIKGFGHFGPYLDDAAVVALRLSIEDRFKFLPSKDYFYDVVTTYARDKGNAIHPVRDYLAGLKWDSQPRLDNWMTVHLGAEDTLFNRAVGAIWMIAAVRRIRLPGCKFDEMPVFESPQGMEKSSMLAVLAGSDDHFTDNVPLSADSKRMIEQTRGKWIVEIADLSGMGKAEIEHVKGLLSRRVDESRAAYGRLTQSVPRAFVIAGTTNDDRYLKDLTGNRRFWPVKVGRIDLDALRRDRDQLWAEAAYREAGGESVRLDPSLWGDAAIAQEARQVENPFLDRLSEALADHVGKITTDGVYTLAGLEPTKRAQTHLALVRAAMEALGWEKTKLRFDSAHPLNCFAKGAPDERMLTLSVIWCGDTKRYEVQAPDLADRMAATVQAARQES